MKLTAAHNTRPITQVRVFPSTFIFRSEPGGIKIMYFGVFQMHMIEYKAVKFLCLMDENV